jgi:hypothetical protein
MMDFHIVARDHFDVTPHDTNSQIADALYVGVAGTVRCVSANGRTANYTVLAGGQVPTKVTIVKATGTTATGIVGLIL